MFCFVSINNILDFFLNLKLCLRSNNKFLLLHFKIQMFNTLLDLNNPILSINYYNLLLVT
jgi:hypothetical protein